MSGDFGEFGDIEELASVLAGEAGFRFHVVRLVETAGFKRGAQRSRLCPSMHVHVVHVRIVPKEMVVECGDVDSVIEQSGQNRIHSSCQQHQGQPSSVGTVGTWSTRSIPEPKGGRRGKTLDSHRQSLRGNVPPSELPL